MTNEQAYVEGFCKAAEVLGVDPAALVKRAQAVKVYSKLGALLSKARVGAKNGGKRYLELLRGGNPETLDTGRQLLNGTLLNRLRMRLGRTLGIRTAPEISKELRKSLATQLGTGAGVAGAGAGLYALRGGGDGTD